MNLEFSLNYLFANDIYITEVSKQISIIFEHIVSHSFEWVNFVINKKSVEFYGQF